MEENSFVTQIENEYKRIDRKWLTLHFKTSAGLVILIFLMEFVLGVAVFILGNIEMTFPDYILKYIFAPLALNIIFISVDYWAMHSSVLVQKTKIYVVSFVLVAICFVVYSIHIIFGSLFLIFTLPVLLTVVYGDYILTSITALFAITAKIVAQLVVKWDSEAIGAFSTTYSSTNFIISAIILCTFFVVCLIVIRFEKEKIEASILKEIERYSLQIKSQTDELTSLLNRSALRNAFSSMEQDTSANSYIFVMIDLDHFKLLNDTRGHAYGDKCLNAFGKILKANAPDASSFRFGGDEFCILFKNQSMQTVEKSCHDIQRDFKLFTETSLSGLPVGVSFGIARFENQTTASQLLKSTDSALYRAKRVSDSIIIDDDASIAQ